MAAVHHMQYAVLVIQTSLGGRNGLIGGIKSQWNERKTTFSVIKLKPSEYDRGEKH